MAPVLRLEALLRDAANDDIRPVNGSERIWQVGDPPLFCRDRAGRQHRVDTFRRDVANALEWLKQSGAHAVVDSWHDDRQWIVALIR